MTKRKQVSDPVYGFVTIPSDLIFSLIEEPVFQRLRRIKQMGLADFVYPGAIHTRFSHALGAMHLMSMALNNLRSKGCDISEREYESALIAILLHDVGHGPFSHALEASILNDVSHEKLSYLFMQHLNRKYDGALEVAIQIFCNTYPRPFLHQLVSSQLDIDRLDYLKRDCFYTGVSEGNIGVERIVNVINVVDERLVVEEKGMYSIEHFLNARRLMYWQVYLHKTAISAENMLIQVIRRAKHLTKQGDNVFATPALRMLIDRQVQLTDFECDVNCLDAFAAIDDYDVWGSIKMWVSHSDRVLATISRMLLERKLFKVLLSNEKPEKAFVQQMGGRVKQHFQLSRQETDYFFIQGSTSNAAYVAGGETINILTKKGKLVDIASASDLPNIKAMSKIVKKYFLCYPKEVAVGNGL